MQRSSNVLVTALVLGLGVLSASSALAEVPDKERAYRFELRALGTYAGEAVFSIGTEEMVGKRKLRAVRIDAHTAGLAANFLAGQTQSVVYVNAAWLPIKVRWDQTINNVKRIVKATFETRKIKATDEKDGKPEKIELATPQHALDLVSVFPWLMQAELSPGMKYEIPVFDGRRLYNVSVTAGIAKEIQVPVGFRNAIPLKIVVTRGEYKREMDLWLSAEKDRTPLRMVFKYGLIGTVEASLVGEKKT